MIRTRTTAIVRFKTIAVAWDSDHLLFLSSLRIRPERRNSVRFTFLFYCAAFLFTLQILRSYSRRIRKTRLLQILLRSYSRRIRKTMRFIFAFTDPGNSRGIRKTNVIYNSGK